MSHWTKIKMKVSDEHVLMKALERMGLKAQLGKFSISQYGTTEKAEVKIDDAVGFSRQADGTFSMVGDFYHSHGKLRQYYGKNKQFETDLTTAYAVEEAVDRLESQGFFIETNEEAQVGQDGLITIVFSDFAG